MNDDYLIGRHSAYPAGRPVAEADDIVIEEEGVSGRDASGINLRAIWSVLYRNRYIMLATLALALLLGVGITMMMTPIYSAQATLQIEQQEQQVLPGESAAEQLLTPIQDAERFLQTQLDIMRSRYLAEQVAQELDLYRSDEFLAAMQIELDPEELESSTERRRIVLETLEENLTVALPPESRIAALGFLSPDPGWAATLANSYAENAITANLQRKFDRSSYTRDFLRDQLAAAKRRLEDSERLMIGYARQAGLIDTSGGQTADQISSGSRSLTTSSLVQLNNAYSEAVANRIDAQERWEQASSTPAESLPQVLGNLAIQRLFEQRAAAEAQYQQERERRKEDFPSVRQAAAQIDELDRQIATLAGRIKSSIREEYEIARNQEQALGGRIEALKEATLSEQDRSVRYNILKREVDTNREMYEGLLQRFKEVSAEAGITSNNVSLLDRAEIPTEPVSPRPAVNLALAGLGGFVFASMLIFVRERLDDIVRSPEDLEEKLGLAAVGVIPVTEDLAAELEDPRSAVSEAYYALRTSLELVGRGGLPESLLFTSSQPGEGKSTTAYATARGFGSIGRKVILIDADLRKPSAHRQAGVKNKAGLSNLLASQGGGLEDVIQKNVAPGLDLITAGPQPPNPAELLAGPQVRAILARLSEIYDLVVIDAPPVMGLSDAPQLGSNVAATVFVIEANRAHRGQAKIALRKLSATHGNVIGAVLTKFDSKLIGYSSYSSYGYGYGYGYEDDK